MYTLPVACQRLITRVANKDGRILGEDECPMDTILLSERGASINSIDLSIRFKHS